MFTKSNDTAKPVTTSWQLFEAGRNGSAKGTSSRGDFAGWIERAEVAGNSVVLRFADPPRLLRWDVTTKTTVREFDPTTRMPRRRYFDLGAKSKRTSP